MPGDTLRERLEREAGYKDHIEGVSALLREAASRIEELERAFRESCDYARSEKLGSCPILNDAVAAARREALESAIQPMEACALTLEALARRNPALDPGVLAVAMDLRDAIEALKEPS